MDVIAVAEGVRYEELSNRLFTQAAEPGMLQGS